MVAVLDNFHFDLSSLQSPSDKDGVEAIITASPGGELQAPSGQTLSQELSQDDDDAEASVEHKDKNPEEMEMEEDNDEDSYREDEKSVEEDKLMKRRAMAQKIHKAIVNSILPSLEAVLTKRVSIMTLC